MKLKDSLNTCKCMYHIYYDAHLFFCDHEAVK